jgi:hypothetical protein
MRRLYDDAGIVKRIKGQKKKKGGETDAKLTISNISYQKEKELTDDRVSEMCDCCCCFCYRSAYIYIYIYTCTWFHCVLL